MVVAESDLVSDSALDDADMASTDTNSPEPSPDDLHRPKGEHLQTISASTILEHLGRFLVASKD